MSVATLNPRAKQLVDEFQTVLGLESYDARRAAFVVFAFFNRGWSKAQIGRFQGISRARIEQKVARYQRYADDSNPALVVLAEIVQASNGNHDSVDSKIEFTAEQWRDDSFAVGLLNRVSQD